MIRKRIALSLVFQLAALSAFAADPAAGLLDWPAVRAAAAAITAATYPDADGVLVDDVIQVTYETNGTAVTWDDTAVKVLTEKGRQELQSLTFGYTRPYDTITVVRVLITKPDGREVEVDLAAQSQTMVDRSQMAMNIFNPNDKTLQVNLPDLEPGDLVRYLYRHEQERARMAGVWCDFQVFESTMPIRRYRYEVSAPAARPLSRTLMRDAHPGTVTSQTNVVGDRIIYRWDLEKVPRYFEEPGMPEPYGQVQRLVLSTVPDWPTVSRWYWNLSQPHLDASSPELAARAAELVAGAATDREKVERLFRFVSQQIRYMGITTETDAPGYEPHDVRITFANRYGVCRDKAALLVAMLRAVGLAGFPVLIHNGPKKDPEVAAPFFNHAIVAVREADGSYQLMDPTDENTSDLLPAYLSDKSYLVASPEGDPLRTSPVAPATNNLVRIETEGTLDREGRLRFATRMVFEGINDNMYRGHLARLAPDERQRFLDARVGQLLPGAQLDELTVEPAELRDTRQPLTVRLRGSVPDFAVDGPGHRMLALPWMGTAFGTVNFVLGQTGLERRRFPLATEFTCGVEESVRLNLEGAGAPLVVPDTAPLREPDIAYEQSVSVSGQVAIGRSRFLLDAVEYPSNRYVRLKEILRELEFSRRQKLVLATELPAPAVVDAEVLARDIRMDVTGPDRWTQTEHYRTRVLSYAGKKRLSELRLDYNPAWEDAQVTNAFVTGTNGVRRDLVAEEINVMDAAWVGSAPRYPPARTRVVSLPGVEVGSVLDYTIVRQRRGRPFFSTLAAFRSFEPCATTRYAITVPADLPVRVEVSAGLVAPEPVADGGRRTWSWAMGPIPALAREESLPPLWSCVPSAAFSAGSWTGLAAAVLGPMAETARVAPRARAKARDLAAAAGTDEVARVRAIRDHVVRAVRLAGPSFDDLPLSVLSPPDRTLAEGYGHGRDRAVLLYAMLEEIGFQPAFLLAAARGARHEGLRSLWRDCPQLGVFDSVLVRVAAGGRTIYLNDTDQYAEPGVSYYDGRPALDRTGQIRSLAVDAPFRERVETDYTVQVQPDGTARIGVQVQFFGTRQAAFHRDLARQTPEERRRFAQETAAAISQAAQLEGELDVAADRYPGTLRYTVTVPRFAVRDGDFLYFNLPAQMAVRLPALPNQRVNPFYTEDEVTVVTRNTVHLPAGALRLAPEDTELVAPGGWGHLTQTVVRPGAAGEPLRVTQELQLAPALIQPASYDEVQQVSARMRHPSLRAVLLKLEP